MTQKESRNPQIDPWILEYKEYDPKKEKSREALLAVGNGYFGTRGSIEESVAGDFNYPGTYFSGLYNRLISKVGNRDIENEDFVNCPNWTYITFRVGHDSWMEFNHQALKKIERKLHFANGVLERNVIFLDRAGHETEVTSRRMASMADAHHAVVQYCVKPLNYSGKISFKSGLIGKIINDGVERYRDLNQKHLKYISHEAEGNQCLLSVKTVQSDIEIIEAAKHRVLQNNKEVFPDFRSESNQGDVFMEFDIEIKEGDEVCIEKLVTLYTSRPDDTANPAIAAKEALASMNSFVEERSKSEAKWEELWKKIDIKVEGDDMSQMLIRLHLFHLMVTASPHKSKIDSGIPARGLHGEAYRGHIFWDELYLLPVFYLNLPEVAKSVLLYRYNRIDKAREYAREHQYKGAMFPWQSGSDGREETQIVHLNPISGEWGDDYSSLQRHISIAIAFNIWNYYWYTLDTKFVKEYGAEMFFEICRFWFSKAEYNEKSGRYEIKNVMGPDEFHEKYPDANVGGLHNNAYTNIMVAWLMMRAKDLLSVLGDRKDTVKQKINLTDDELSNWEEFSHSIKIEIDDEDIIAQFEGYFNLKMLDWDEYREKYGNIHRLDRILKAEGKSPDEYQLAKQADTLMTFYNLDSSMIKDILYESGYYVGDDFLQKNFDYYIQRTSHGSTLSRVVHASLANEIGRHELAWELYSEALASDYDDIQGGTTGEGIHAGVMGGTVFMVLSTFAGLNFNSDHLHINPNLPPSWKSIAFNFTFRENYYTFAVNNSEIEVKVENNKNTPVVLNVHGKEMLLEPDQIHTIKIA